MSSKYPWNIPADKDSFDLLSPDQVKQIWNRFPKCSQSIRYNEDLNEVVFISKNIADITNAIENKLWEHTRNPRKIDKEWIAYIIPKKSLIDKYPNLAHGATFKITGKAQKSSKPNKIWQSEL